MTGHRVLTLSLYHHGMHFSSHPGSRNNPPWLRFWFSTPLVDKFSAVALERERERDLVEEDIKEGTTNRGCVLVALWVCGYCEGQPQTNQLVM